MDSLLNDLRYGARMLRKSKGLTTVALLSLAAGIGGNAAIFSLLNSILFRPRALAEPDRLVAVYAGDRQQPYQTLSYPTYQDLRNRNRSFSGLAAYELARQFSLTGGDQVEQVWGETVSANYFEVLGVPMLRGRGFLAEEEGVPTPVVVIGAGLWQRRYSSDPEIVGKPITVNHQPMTVVGVVSPRYNGMMGGWASEVWVPTAMAPLLEASRGSDFLSSRDSKWVALIGRLKPGVTMAEARTELETLANRLKREHPEEWMANRDATRESFLSVLPERDTRVHPQARGAAFGVAALLFGIVDLVLLIACVNLAGMHFARAVTRRSEVAVRLSLGATRRRIVRQLLTESVLLSLLAGVLGTGLALWGIQALAASFPALAYGVRFAVDLRIDWRVLLYSLGFASVTGLLFGLAPALHASRTSLVSVLKDEATVATRFRRSGLRQILLIAQVAFSLLLLIGAGLILRGLEKARPTRLGFATDRMLVASVQLDESRYDRRAAQTFFETLAGRVAQLPGVRAVSLADAMPGGLFSRRRRTIEVGGQVRELDFAVVGPGYFTNLGVPLVVGRDFTELDREGAPCVAIVNEVFSARYLGGTSGAIGQLLFRSDEKGPREACVVVGVVRDDAWQSLNPEVRPSYALAQRQTEARNLTLLVQTAGEPGILTSSVRGIIQQIDPRIPTDEIRTLESHFSATLYPFRLLGMVLTGCGLLALFLALVGIYGIVSYSVAQRRRELGIRVAMGALQRDILGLVVRQGMRPVAIGLVIGLALGVGLAQLVQAIPSNQVLLFGVRATDFVTFAGVTALLGLVALLGCYVPAHRAARVDPVAILKDS